MKRKDILLFLLIFCLWGNTLLSQSGNVIFHINKPFYVEGETLYFKAYNLNTQNKSNNLAFFGLYMPNGSDLVSDPLFRIVENESIEGQVKLSLIPGDGYYRLRVFFNDMVYSTQIPVFQKSLPQNFQLSEVNDSIFAIEKQIEPGYLQLNTTKEYFDENDKVHVSVSHQNQNKVLDPLKYSISVYRQTNAPFNTILEAKTKEYPLDINYGLNGTMVSTITGEPLTNTLITAYFIHSGLIYSAYTDSNGYLSITTEGIYQDDLVYFQAFTPSLKRIGEARLTEISEQKIPILAESSIPELSRNQSINNYIHQVIYEEYTRQNYNHKTSHTEVLEDKSYSFDFNFEIYPDRYFEIASIRDAVREIIPFAKIKKVKKQDAETILLRNNKDNSKFPGSPVFFINEIPFLNPQHIFELNYDDIEKIIVINEPILNSQFYHIGMYGIFKVVLKPDAKNPVEYLRSEMLPVYKSDFPSNLDLTNNTCHPCFKSAVYWNSILNLNIDDEFEFDFPSDFSGYKIEVFGVSNSGLPVFQVKNIYRNEK